MARGQQKIQSQQKAQLKAKEKAKAGNSMTQKKAAEKALVYKCTVCMTQMSDLKTYRQHFESKHPKSEIPAELKEVEAAQS